MNKYRNKKTTVDGIEFDSIKESNRYQELKLLQRAGIIKDLEIQPAFVLIPAFKRNNKTYRKTSYIADFKYFDKETNKIVVEDVKSEITAKEKAYRIKIKLFLYLCDVDFREIRY